MYTECAQSVHRRRWSVSNVWRVQAPGSLCGGGSAGYIFRSPPRSSLLSFPLVALRTSLCHSASAVDACPLYSELAFYVMPNDVNEEAEAALGLLGIIAAPPSTIPAKRKLSASPAAPVANDFFLGEFHDDFMDNARYLITEAYCRIHQRIDIAYVASSLGIGPGR